ncbi:MAG: DUF2325 domain-containing protein [Pseudomonadota bacterium]|nr:DUF2325 domain-containing protein [Pseudomonadota bacterium]
MSFLFPPASVPPSTTRPVFGMRQKPPALPVLSGDCDKDCCAAGTTAAKPTVRMVAAPARRSRLTDLDANIHCSIIGTCLSTNELRKLIGRYVPQLSGKDATDVEIHHTAVNLSTGGGIVAKELNKALDARHALTIKKFRTAQGEPALKQLWQDALAQGDVPGAYWALMTHPESTFPLRSQAFGEVHMLSHLVGAANRADIRRVAALEEETTRLKEANAALQVRLNAASTQHAATLADMAAQARQLQLQRDTGAAPEQLVLEMAQLRAALADREEKLSLHTARRHEAEQKHISQQARYDALQADYHATRDELETARLELGALEHAFEENTCGVGGGMGGSGGKSALPPLDGKCVLYVGGRPGCAERLCKMVATAGGELLVHDGGIEDRHGMLATMLPRAQMVVFPIDCISHNAMHVAKQACARRGIACHPIRSASVASFVALMQRLATDGSAVETPVAP